MTSETSLFQTCILFVKFDLTFVHFYFCEHKPKTELIFKPQTETFLKHRTFESESSSKLGRKINNLAQPDRASADTHPHTRRVCNRSFVVLIHLL